MQQAVEVCSRHGGVWVNGAGVVVAQVILVVEARVIASVVVDEVAAERGIDTDDPPAGELGCARRR